MRVASGLSHRYIAEILYTNSLNVCRVVKISAPIRSNVEKENVVV